MKFVKADLREKSWQLWLGGSMWGGVGCTSREMNSYSFQAIVDDIKWKDLAEMSRRMKPLIAIISTTKDKL